MCKNSNFQVGVGITVGLPAYFYECGIRTKLIFHSSCGQDVVVHNYEYEYLCGRILLRKLSFVYYTRTVEYRISGLRSSLQEAKILFLQNSLSSVMVTPLFYSRLRKNFLILFKMKKLTLQEPKRKSRFFFTKCV